MVGREVGASEARGDRIAGDAALTVADFTDPRIAVTFTNIKNLETGRAHDDMAWRSIPLAEGGFAAGSAGDSIKGQFYGPNHEEVGGVFERNQVIGAFGAKR